jgi:RNA polymerase sigma-70 factor (ECF subfamily)
MSDEEFVQQVFDASYPRLVGQLTAVTRSRSEAEDVVQEAFVRALARRRQFAALDNPEAWLRTVALNLTRSQWRRMRRLTGLLPDLVPDDPPEDLSPDRVALLAAIRKLPRAQQETIALHHLADLPVNEVAETLGVPVGTVKARLSRGRAALAQLLAITTESSS